MTDLIKKEFQISNISEVAKEYCDTISDIFISNTDVKCCILNCNNPKFDRSNMCKEHYFTKK